MRHLTLIVLIVALCTALALSACHGGEDNGSILPTPAPTPCEDGRTREGRIDCLKVCKKGCVERFPLGETRRTCLEGCRTSCYEQFPPGCFDGPGTTEE